MVIKVIKRNWFRSNTDNRTNSQNTLKYLLYVQKVREKIEYVSKDEEDIEKKED